jgi:hypothetical protein
MGKLMGSTLAALVITVTTMAAGQVPDTAEQSQGDCVAFETPPRLDAGTSFTTSIGSGLEFRLTASQNVWNISAGPAETGEDYLWIVSPPLQTAPHRQIGAGYGLTAAQNVGVSSRTFRFATSRQEYQRAAKLVEAATTNPGSGIGVKDIEQAGRGILQIWITGSGMNTEGTLEWIAVRGRACVAPEPSPKR